MESAVSHLFFHFSVHDALASPADVYLAFAVPVSYTHLDVYKRQGLAPEHKTVSCTDENDREDLLKKASFTDVRFGPLYNRVLLRYLAERGISRCV